MVTYAYVLFGVGIPLKNRGDLLTDSLSTLVAVGVGGVADLVCPCPVNYSCTCAQRYALLNFPSDGLLQNVGTINILAKLHKLGNYKI